MGKQLSSIAMTLLFLFLTTLGPLLPEAASAASVPVTANTAVQAAKTVNVALNAQATASGQCNDNEKASFAVDGKTDTKWCDNSTGTKKWLRLDLGQEYNINEWIVMNAAINESGNSPFWNTKDFRLQKSVDGSTWETVDFVTDNVQTIVDRYVPAFTARYVRLYIDKGAYDSNTVRLYEFKVFGTTKDQTPAYPQGNLDPVDYVDPFINTLGDNGQTNPGATTPFGLVSLGPDSDGGAFSGYYYQNQYLKGFSHLRFSGVGCSGAGGNILMMPETQSFTKNSGEYKQKYDKASEIASPGYYAVDLVSGIGVELTTSQNVGFHRYTFPTGETDGSVLVDLSNSYAGMVDANLKVENNNTISGMIQSKNVCGHGYYTMYYSIQFDHDFNSYSSWQGDAVGTEAQRTGSNSGVWLNFNTADSKVVQAKVGLSTISVDQAKKERDQDIQGWDFDAQHAKTRSLWSDALSKVEITDSNEENKTVFYTQLYHAYLHPNNVTSSDGTFRAARDENTIRQTSEVGEDFEYYNGWTTWDDFRKYSLYSLLEPQKYENMVKSMIDVYKTRGSYAQWGDGYWPSPTVRNEFNGAVILDAYAKGFDFGSSDLSTALQGMAVDTDNYTISDSEISGKLEKAYSAYYPMKLAEMIGDKATYEKYKPIALSYKKLWNANQVDEKGTKRGFFTPNGGTVSPNDITPVDKFAYQGNLWTYRWFVPQDINGLAELIGGKREMAQDLQHFFAIDEYMAVNEPDLHVPYLFNYLGMPYLTQYYAREYTTEVVTQKYHNHGLYAYPMKSRVYRDDPEGYLQSMDDDAGAMSSWFVYSAMGLYPGNPGDPYYLVGSPIFPEMKLHLDNGKTFTIKADNVSSDNRFIQSAKLNGQNFDQAWISYEDVMAGGAFELEMGAEPNTKWGAASNAAPPTTDFSADFDDLLIRKDLIAGGSDWEYFDQGRDAGAGWTSLEYDDSSWSSGPAMLGYDKFNNVKTQVSYGPDAGNKYPTTYFRKTFEVKDASDVSALEASLIRDDGAVVYLNGHEIIRTNMPSGQVGYGTYANVTVNDERDRNVYSVDPAYLVEGKNVLAAEVHQSAAASSDIAFDFGLQATRSLSVPEAPTGPLVDDEANTFGWTPVQGFEQASAYEYSTDSGKTWKTASANPQSVGPGAYKAGAVQVRVKASESQDLASGRVLVSDKAYTGDRLWDVYDLAVKVEQKGNLQVNVTGKLTGDYQDSAVVVYQLMDGKDHALLSSSVPVKNGDFQLTQTFNVNAAKYKVNVYLVDAYNGDVYDSTWLADPVAPQPMPEPESPVDPGPEPEEPGTPGGEYPDPLPLPDKKPAPTLPDDSEEEPGEVQTIEFEDNSGWTTAVNTFNNGALKTEANHGGTTVGNTFAGAWIAYKGINFGTAGKNRITIEYDAPTNRVPADSAIEVRLGSVDGELLGTVALKNTGGAWGTYTTSGMNLTRTLTGKQDLYLVMKGSTDKDHPYIGNLDRFSFETIRSDYAKLELESYNAWSTEVNPVNKAPLKLEAGKSGKQVANTFSGAWMLYKKMDFGSNGANQLSIEYSGNSGNCAVDSAVEVRLGSVTGTLVGRIAIPPTANSWGTYATATGNLTQKLTGIQDVYLVLTGTTDTTFKYIANVDNASFSLRPAEPDVTVEFESSTTASQELNTFNNKGLKTEPNNGGTTVGNTFTGMWLAYSKVNFGTQGKNHVEIVYDAPTNRVPADVTAEIRLNDKNGEILATVNMPATGTSWGNYKTAGSDLKRPLSGEQNICVVFKGSTTSSLNYIGNLDKMIFSLNQ
ncbi:Endo-1,4-beta-xylanase A precursor [compost metagenome]